MGRVASISWKSTVKRKDGIKSILKRLDSTMAAIWDHYEV